MLDNLISVTQGTQVRTFAYDALSRLICASNPETRAASNPSCSTTPLPASGLDRFTYDNNGNLETKTDARGFTTTLVNDALNRVTARTFNDANTPGISYVYDSGTDCAKGLLCSVSRGNATTAYQYDSLGRVKKSIQTILEGASTLNYEFLYQYNEGSRLTQITYPSGKVVKQDYDLAGRLSKVYRSDNSLTYADSIKYAPHGPLSEVLFGLAQGQQLKEERTFNDRLQAYTVGLSKAGASRFSLTYAYFGGNNGNLWKQTIGDGSSFSPVQEYSYDAYNRLQSAQESPTLPGGWKRTYGYDRWGNRRVDTTQSSGLPVDPHTPVAASWFLESNRLNLANAYDAAGNQTAYSPFTLAYDAENHIRSVTSSGNGSATYVYDGEGRRVKRTVVGSGGPQNTYYVYDAFGRLAAEYSAEAGYGKAACNLCYLIADALGTTRVVADGAGAIRSRLDYLPFGEQIPADRNGRANAACQDGPAFCYGAGMGVAQKFTGKERDAETGLDYFGARYMSSAQGRFSSGDPAMESAFIEDPQTWNRYSYVHNRPLALVDPDGRAAQLATAGGGALLGFGLGFAGYAFAQQVSGGEFHLQDAIAAGIGGAVSGALAGATLGASIVTSPLGVTAVGAGANAVGGVAARTVDSDAAGTDPFAGEEIFSDLYAGTVSTVAGVAVGGTYRMASRVRKRPWVGPRHRRKVERQYRQDFKAHDDRATNRDAFVGSLGTNVASPIFFATEAGREVKRELKRKKEEIKEEVKSRIFYH